ncbi:MAG: hypothetical protein IJQ87_00090 [Clostridia bacterium]|nr:hypothetical protein [Clostridia bacterium]
MKRHTLDNGCVLQKVAVLSRLSLLPPFFHEKQHTCNINSAADEPSAALFYS